MVTELVKVYLAIGAGGLACVLVGLFFWKFANFLMSLVRGQMKDILRTQEKITLSLEKHDKHSTVRDTKIVQSIDNLLGFQNGSNPKFKEHDGRLKKIEKMLDKS